MLSIAAVVCFECSSFCETLYLPTPRDMTTFNRQRVAFISAASGTFPGKDSVLVSNRTEIAVPRLGGLVDGGFDPRAITAESDDLLELTDLCSRRSPP
jgi:hypothetical protein